MALAVIALSFSLSYQILLPVVPVIAQARGGPALAGAATTALSIGAVVGEVATGWLMIHITARKLILLAHLAVMGGSIVFALPDPAVSMLLGGAALRGLGMGVSQVASLAVLAVLSSRDSRGRAIGTYGLALSAPAIVAPAMGISLASHGFVLLDAILASISGLIGGLAVWMVPPVKVVGIGAVASWKAMGNQRVLLPLLGYVIACCSFGALATYVPIALPQAGLGSAAAFLFIMGLTRTLARWLVGRLSNARRIEYALATASGVVVVASCLLAVGEVLGVVVSAITYGIAFGVLQTTAFLAILRRVGEASANLASSGWSSGTDLGIALGGVLVGVAAAHGGYLVVTLSIAGVGVLMLPCFLVSALIAEPRLHQIGSVQ